MPKPRSQLAPPGTPGRFHCVQRCVRRAFLCGTDRDTGQCFEHRKHWVEGRLHLLAECFAISIHAYAVMSNHLHLVVELIPAAVSAWTDHDVAARWVRLFPPRSQERAAIDAKCMRLTADPARLLAIRRRLADLSWLMRCLAEPIARRANREDACKGRFWEGRFKAQRLCDERALLAAMAYVDLNPVRAGIAKELEDSAHTSVALRMQRTKDRRTPLIPLGPILGVLRPAMSLSERDYLQLLDWTGRQFVPGKRGRIAAVAPAALRRIAVAPDRWTMQVRGIGCGYWRTVGSLCDLADLAKTLGQRWLKGQRFAALVG